jgi:hypothetical protein
MQRVPMESSAISSAGYDPERSELEVEFRTGRVYVYRDVPAGVFEFLLRTPNKGGYLNRMIHGRYAYRELGLEDAPEQDLLDVLKKSLGMENA